MVARKPKVPQQPSPEQQRAKRRAGHQQHFEKKAEKKAERFRPQKRR